MRRMRPSFIIASFIALLPIILYYRTRFQKGELFDKYELRSSAEGPRKLVLFAISYIGYKTKKTVPFSQVQIAAREYLGRERTLSFFMDLDLSVDRQYDRMYLPLLQEPTTLSQFEGLTKLFQFLREIRGNGKKLLLFNGDRRDINEKLIDFCEDAGMMNDLNENVYAVGEWYDLMYNKYKEIYPKNGEAMYAEDILALMLEQSKGPLRIGETFLEHSLKAQVPFLNKVGLKASDFSDDELSFF